MRSATCLQTLHILLSFALIAARKAFFLCVINSSTSRKPKYLLHSISTSLELVLEITLMRVPRQQRSSSRQNSTACQSCLACYHFSKLSAPLSLHGVYRLRFSLVVTSMNCAGRAGGRQPCNMMKFISWRLAPVTRKTNRQHWTTAAAGPPVRPTLDRVSSALFKHGNIWRPGSEYLSSTVTIGKLHLGVSLFSASSFRLYVRAWIWRAKTVIFCYRRLKTFCGFYSCKGIVKSVQIW